MSEEKDKTEQNLVIRPERMNPQAPAPIPKTEVSPMALVQLAVQRGDDIEKLNQIVALAERMQANQAKQAFNEAFAAFKAESVRIIKTTLVTDGPLKGKKYADLFDIVNAVSEPLAKHGLSASWKLTKDEPAWMEVTCTLKHVAGHSESDAQGGPVDTGPGRNAIQARRSTRTYLEKSTLTGITGLAAADSDDDGRASSNGGSITEDQAATLDSLIDDVGADRAKFMRYLKVEDLHNLPASSYADAVAALNAKRKKATA